MPLVNFIIKENPHLQDLSVHDLWRWTVEREIYRGTYNHCKYANPHCQEPLTNLL